jgi:hypothetical protein
MTDMADSSSTPPVPPTLPTLPPPDLTAPASVLIAVEESPKPKRGKWIALAAVVVLLIGGFVGYLLMSGDDKGERYALQPALQSSQEVDSLAMKMTMSFGFIGEISFDMRLDNEAQLAAMVMSMAGEGEDGGTIEMIIDTANSKVYIDNESLGVDAFDVPTRWIVTDADDALGLGGLGTSSDPGELATALEDATTQEDLGIEQRDGEDVRHYRLTVSLEALAAVSSELEEQFSGLGEEVPDDVLFDVYVTADNLLRAITYEMDLMGQTMEIEMEFSDYNSIDPIVIPDPSDVTEQDLPDF